MILRVLVCDGCGKVMGKRAPASANDDTLLATAAERGWTHDEDAEDYCPECTNTIAIIEEITG